MNILLVVYAKLVAEVMSQAWNELQAFSCKLHASLKDHGDVL